MAFHRSSVLLRKIIGSRTTAVVCSSYTSRRCYSSLESGIITSATGYHINNGSSYMRATVFWEKNKSLTFENFHTPRTKANEFLIKTKACGVCHSDLHVIKGEIPFASPCVVGHEITGEVVEHGPPSDSRNIQRVKITYASLSMNIIERNEHFMMVKQGYFSGAVVHPNKVLYFIEH